MQINNLTRFKEKINRNQLCLGMVITLTDPSLSELAGDVGWDFTWIDLEHAPLSIETALGHVMAIRASTTAPLLRVPDNNAATIKPLLELAPAGVIIPMVNSAADAAAAVAACRYPVQGVRGCGPRRGTGYGAIPLNDYFQQAGHNPMVIVQIEHINAVGELDEILAVPGIDSICVGPCDLAASMGKLEDMDNPAVGKVIDEICAKTKAAGKILGTAGGGSKEIIATWRRRGADWLAVASDWGCVATVSKQILQRERKQENSN